MKRLFIQKIFYYLIRPNDFILRLMGRGFLPVPDSVYLKILYKKKFGRKLNLNDPQTFNEKLQWLKLYDRNPLYTSLVDKYLVKGYVKDALGQEVIVPTLQVWDSPEKVDFADLPKEFVLKCNHDSGGVIICKDKDSIDAEEIRNKIRAVYNKNYYLEGREWPYKNVEKKIIAEKMLIDSTETDLKDYKLMCFNGKVKCIFVCSERGSIEGLKVTFFDTEWNVMPFQRHYPKSKVSIPKPKCLEEMIIKAEKLSDNIPFVRIDFYEVDGHIYFGEYTFYPGCGFEEFTPDDADYMLGSWIELPNKRK